MSGQRWRFTPPEVQALWPLVGVSRVPFPFDVRPSSASVAEHREAQRRAQDSLVAGGVVLAEQLEPDLAAALEVLVHPAVSLDATGFFTDSALGGAAVVRVLAAAVRGSGVLAVQLPGSDARTGGDLLVETVPADQLPQALVRALPPAPAGSEPGVRVPRDDLRPDARADAPLTGSPLLSSGQRAVGRLRELTTSALWGAGQVGARSGPARDVTVRWFDRPDGRYLMQVDDAVTVTPASAHELATAAGQQLGAVTRRR